MLTAGRNTQYRGRELLPIPVAATTKIYGGAIVCINATGFAVPGSTATTLTYVGRAEDTVDNLAGVDGAKTVTVRRQKAFKWSNLAADLITQADLYKTAYVVDDETVAKGSGGNTRSVAGRIVGIDPDGVWIE
jgi:hypothetical protein